MRRFGLEGAARVGALVLLACVPEDPPALADDSTGGPVPECQTDADCPAVCAAGRCVECSTNEHCSNPKPICVGEVCQGCSAPQQCPEYAPICKIDDCLPCTSDAECLELGKDVCSEGACSGCSIAADCPPDYPVCAEGQCTFACAVDLYESLEPLELGDHLDGGVITGYVCKTDPLDRFTLALTHPAYVALELYADTKAGNVELALVGPDDAIVRFSHGHGGLEVIHTRVTTAGIYEVQVSLESGPAGAPFELEYRTLLAQ